MNPTIGVAVVGVGYWGRNVARNFHELGALTTLCDADSGAEARCRTQYPGITFHRDYRAVLDDPAVSAVALATPATTHYEMARAALDAGKDVLVEKPLAIEVAHVRIWWNGRPPRVASSWWDTSCAITPRSSPCSG
jgi:UDP-2-acetamido-3-amino-2,3-dideoxy-glucuronate N-acetyltransferase